MLFQGMIYKPSVLLVWLAIKLQGYILKHYMNFYLKI